MTLIEMLVTIAVMGVGVVGIAYGFSVVVRSSGDAQEQATLDGAARDAADYIQSTLTYNVCATPPYSLSGLSKPADVSSWTITSVSESSAASLAGFPKPHRCGRRSSTTGYDYGVQEITITVTDNGLSVTQVVWKDDLS
jgi:prepilin-type N-terminal cleavage/methylation domain-containing protein